MPDPEQHALSDQDNDEPSGRRNKEARLDNGDDYMLNGENGSEGLFAEISDTPGFLDPAPAPAGIEQFSGNPITPKLNSHREGLAPSTPAGLGYQQPPGNPKPNSHRDGLAPSAPAGLAPSAPAGLGYPQPPRKPITQKHHQVQFEDENEDESSQDEVRPRPRRSIRQRKPQNYPEEPESVTHDNQSSYEENEQPERVAHPNNDEDEEEPAFTSGREIEIAEGILVGYLKVGTGSKFICQLGPKRCGQYRLFSSAANTDWKTDVEEDKRKPKEKREYYNASDQSLRKLKSSGSRKNYRGIAGVAHESGASMDPSQKRMPRTLIKIAWTNATSTWETRTDFRSLRGKKDADKEIFDAVDYYKKAWDTFNSSNLGWQPNSIRARSQTPAYSTSQPSTRQPSEVPQRSTRQPSEVPRRSTRQPSEQPPERTFARSQRQPSASQPQRFTQPSEPQNYGQSQRFMPSALSSQQDFPRTSSRQPSEPRNHGQSQRFTQQANHQQQHQGFTQQANHQQQHQGFTQQANQGPLFDDYLLPMTPSMYSDYNNY